MCRKRGFPRSRSAGTQTTPSHWTDVKQERFQLFKGEPMVDTIKGDYNLQGLCALFILISWLMVRWYKHLTGSCRSSSKLKFNECLFLSLERCWSLPGLGVITGIICSAVWRNPIALNYCLISHSTSLSLTGNSWLQKKVIPFLRLNFFFSVKVRRGDQVLWGNSARRPHEHGENGLGNGALNRWLSSSFGLPLWFLLTFLGGPWVGHS